MHAGQERCSFKMVQQGLPAGVSDVNFEGTSQRIRFAVVFQAPADFAPIDQHALGVGEELDERRREQVNESNRIRDRKRPMPQQKQKQI